ncbi:hypothetical protein [Rubrivirga sp. IMCC45206]|uniref:hypothetical protein n=1 Tax=Rubrivirga sp. IMCC45206 TaxID=3391614 RepID=UPI0039901A6D
MRAPLVLAALTLVFAACDAHHPASSTAAATAADYDVFADAVVTDGVVVTTQGFPDPAGALGAFQVLDPAKAPPVTGIGVGGFVVLDLGAGEGVVDGPGPDLLVVESDGTVLAAGFGFAEPGEVAVSDMPGGPFVSLGEVNGTGLFDLAGSGLRSARYVRVTDTGGAPPSGFDLNGVAAVNAEGAGFRLTPSTLTRGSRRPTVTGHVSAPAGFRLAAAEIVLATTVDEPAPPGPRPVFTTLAIEGDLRGNGGTVKFPADEVLAAAPDGEVVVGVRLTSTMGDELILFDTVDVR